MSQKIKNVEAPFLEAIKKSSGLAIAVGVILMVLGVFAMSSPFIVGLSIALMVGVMLIIGGIGQMVVAVKAGKKVFTLLIGTLTVIIGVYMVSYPGIALASLTIFLAVYLVVSGIFETLMAFQVRPASGWGWMLFIGILSMLLGVMIWSQFPLSDAWAIGILIGARLFCSGWTLLILGFAARGAAKASVKLK